MFAASVHRDRRQVIQVGGEDVRVLVAAERRDEPYLGLLELRPVRQG